MRTAYAEVIGDPISHSKSPLIHNFWLNELAIDAEYRACHVLPGDLEVYFAERRQDPDWRGCNVTIPHKEAVGAFLDSVDDRAKAVGAVNTVFQARSGKLVGSNTDVNGVADALAEADLSGTNVCIIGAGGAARAAFHYLSDKRCKVVIMARNPDKALSAARECGLDAIGVPFRAGSAALCEASVLINATQLGMAGQEEMPAFLLDEIVEMSDEALVFDMVYAPLETALLRRAKATGRRTADGLTMLIGQAATAFNLFFGSPAPRERDTELRALLTA